MKLRRTAPEYNGCPIDKVQYLDNCRYIFTVLIFRCVWNMHSRDWTTTPSCPTTRRTDPTSSTRRAATPCTWRWMQPRSPRVQTSRYQSSSPVTTAVLPRVSRYIFLDILISTYIYGQHTYLHNLHLSKAKMTNIFISNMWFYIQMTPHRHRWWKGRRRPGTPPSASASSPRLRRASLKSLLPGSGFRCG